MDLVLCCVFCVNVHTMVSHKRNLPRNSVLSGILNGFTDIQNYLFIYLYTIVVISEFADIQNYLFIYLCPIVVWNFK